MEDAKTRLDELFEESDDNLFVTRKAELFYEKIASEIVSGLEQRKEDLENGEPEGMAPEAWRYLVIEAAAAEMRARQEALLAAMHLDMDLVIERTKLEHHILMGSR